MIDTKIPLPTDNLYKFIALFGLTLVILSFIPFYHSYKVKIEEIEVIANFNKLKPQSDRLIIYIKSLLAEKDYEPEGNLAPKSLLIKEYNKLYMPIEIELNKLEIQTLKNAELKKLVRAELILSIMILLMGVGFMFFGFKHWYYKLQKYQDMIIIKQAGGVEAKKFNFKFKAKLPK